MKHEKLSTENLQPAVESFQPGATISHILSLLRGVEEDVINQSLSTASDKPVDVYKWSDISSLLRGAEEDVIKQPLSTASDKPVDVDKWSDYSQDTFINRVHFFIVSYNRLFGTEYSSLNAKGVCCGLATYWAFYSEQGRMDEFYDKLYRSEFLFDDIAKVEDIDERTVGKMHELMGFIDNIRCLQSPFIYLDQTLDQLSLGKSLGLESMFWFNISCCADNRAHLCSILEEELNDELYKKRVIVLSYSGHMIAIAKTAEGIFLYDANDKTKAQHFDYDKVDSLVDAIIRKTDNCLLTIATYAIPSTEDKLYGIFLKAIVDAPKKERFSLSKLTSRFKQKELSAKYKFFSVGRTSALELALSCQTLSTKESSKIKEGMGEFVESLKSARLQYNYIIKSLVVLANEDRVDGKTISEADITNLMDKQKIMTYLARSYSPEKIYGLREFSGIRSSSSMKVGARIVGAGRQVVHRFSSR